MERLQKIEPNMMGSKTINYFNSNGYGCSFDNRGGFGKYGKTELFPVTSHSTQKSMSNT